MNKCSKLSRHPSLNPHTSRVPTDKGCHKNCRRRAAVTQPTRSLLYCPFNQKKQKI